MGTRVFEELNTFKTDHNYRIENLESQASLASARISDLFSTCDTERQSRVERFGETDEEIKDVRKYINDYETRQSQVVRESEDKVYSNIGKLQHAAEELEERLSKISD